MSILSTTYLGPIEYYAHIYHDKNVAVEQWEHYERQSYANRCCILTASGVANLTIPIEKTDHTPIKDVHISTHSDWQTLHWRAIESAYRNSPFFEYYQDDFVPLYKKEWKYLWDFNQMAQEVVVNILGIEPPNPTKEYRKDWKGKVDLRGLIHPKKATTAISNYVDIPYYQVFQNKFGFTPNLSIIDLLFNMGNEARLILKQSIKR